MEALKSLQIEVDIQQELVANLMKTHELDQQELKSLRDLLSSSEESNKKSLTELRTTKDKEITELEVCCNFFNKCLLTCFGCC